MTKEGGRLDDGAVAALATELAHRAADTDRALERIETKVDRHTDQLSVIQIERFIWPPMAVMLLAVVGGFAGEVLWRLTSAH